MVTADVEELKAKLAEYLAKVKAGEEVMVTEGGRTIARIGPAAEENLTEDERIERMYAAGLLIRAPGRGLPPDFWENRVKDPGGLTLKGLLEEREEGW